MRRLRVLIGIVVALICCSSHALAMGSGPHPNVPYGIPPPPPRLSLSPAELNAMDRPAALVRVYPIEWMILSVAYASVLIWAVQTIRKK